MAIVRYKNVGIKAVSACVPKNVSSNYELGDLFDSGYLEKLVNSIGIKEKRIADKEVCASDLCLEAARQLLSDNKIDPASIDMLLFLTQTPDYIVPATAPILQHRLGLPDTVACMDLSLACSGFIYALSAAFAYASVNGINRVLLLVGDTFSKVVNPRDKVNYPLYGDAGTACLVEKGDYAESCFILTSGGDGAQYVMIPSGGFRNPVVPDSLIDKEREDGNYRRDIDITMDGMSTFNHAVSVLPKSIKQIFKETGVAPDEIDFLVSHQANKFMIDFIVKRVKFNPSKVPFCLAKYGNTSSPSIPLTISSELTGKLDGKKKIVLSAIGAGWTIATAYLETTDVNVSPVIEYEG